METRRGIIDNLHDGTGSIPDRLYKYGHIENDDRVRFTRGVLENNELYCAPPSGLNDPFDSVMTCIADGSKTVCKRLFREWLQRNPDKSRRKHLDFEKEFFRQSGWRQFLAQELEGEIRAKRQEFGVFCMTREKKNIPMWAHYAANHKGFCLEFQTTNSFFSRARKVCYERQLSTVNVLSPWDTLIRHATAALLTKSKDWEKEEEWRIIDLNHGVGIQQCPPKSITGVIVGCRMPTPARRQIADWCKKRKPQPVLYEAKIKNEEFGLDINEISY